MRARTIKPAFFKNEDMAALEPIAQLACIGLWCLADREGRLEDRPKRIRAEVFPYSNVDMDSILGALHNAGFIVRYIGDDECKYIQVNNFTKHQKPHQNEADSVIPAPQSENLLPRYEALGSKVASACDQGTQHLALDLLILDPRSLDPRSLDSSEAKNPPAEPTPAKNTFLEFPCVGTSQAWQLDESQVASWESSYAGVVDVRLEMRKAHQWVLANPQRRKTARGMPKFLTDWLNRACDSNRGRSPTNGAAAVVGNVKPFSFSD